MAVKVFFNIDQGATLNKIVHRVRTPYGANVDMSAYTGSCMLRKNYSANVSYTLDTTLNANGEVVVSANSDVTEAIPSGRYVYDIIGVSGNTTIRVVEGYVSVDPMVTG